MGLPERKTQHMLMMYQHWADAKLRPVIHVTLLQCNQLAHFEESTCSKLSNLSNGPTDAAFRFTAVEASLFCFGTGGFSSKEGEKVPRPPLTTRMERKARQSFDRR